MIVVLLETDATGAVEVSLETLAFARTLSAEGGGVPIDAVVVGDLPEGLSIESLATQVGAHGVRDLHHAGGERAGGECGDGERPHAGCRR